MKFDNASVQETLVGSGSHSYNTEKFMASINSFYFVSNIIEKMSFILPKMTSKYLNVALDSVIKLKVVVYINNIIVLCSSQTSIHNQIQFSIDDIKIHVKDVI